MAFNFDEVCNRQGTNSLKWDIFPKHVLPMWVADMDFKSPPAITSAIKELCENQNYGYTKAPEELYEVIIDRLSNRHHWDIKKEWLVLLPGLVPGLHASARIFENEKANILTSTPVYYHLSLAGKYANLSTKEIPFIWQNNQWEMDFDTFEKQVDEQSKIYMLCNPHNPNGRVFTKKELETLSAFCLKHNLLVVSDEIHCDLILESKKNHISIGSLNKEIEQQSITLLAPSKTFNIAGLGGSFAIIPNPKIRKRFKDACYGIMPHMSAFAAQTVLSAYKYGEPWRLELIDYLKSNHDYLLKEVNKIPSLSMAPLEATYLAWIRCDKSDIPNLEDYLLKFGLGVSGGHQFKGKGYFRINFGTQRSNLEMAVKLLKKAFE